MSSGSSSQPLGELVAEMLEAANELQQLAALFLQEVDNADGCDDTGNVVVTIDADNHIKNSTLNASWHHGIDPARLGDAYAEAVEGAKTKKQAILSNLIDQAEKAGRPVAPVKPSPWDATPDPERPTRTMGQLVNDYLAYQATTDESSELGRNEDGTVSVEANRLGFLWCGFDTHWAEARAERQESWAVASGTVEASQDAKEKLSRVPSHTRTALDIAQDAIRLLSQL